MFHCSMVFYGMSPAHTDNPSDTTLRVRRHRERVKRASPEQYRDLLAPEEQSRERREQPNDNAKRQRAYLHRMGAVQDDQELQNDIRSGTAAMAD
jgi:hypothetical protein